MTALLAVTIVASPLRAFADAEDPSDYRPGDGWTVPHTDLTIGGYANGDFGKETTAPAGFDLSNLSLFMWTSGESHLHFFTEIDLQNAIQIRDGGSSNNGSYLALERLYADWAVFDALNFRIGKFLTPIGRWNLIHAAPLVWTTSRPLVTNLAFPTNATGAMAYGTLTSVGAGLDYSLYASIGKELAPNPTLDTFNEAYGIHLSYPLQPSLQIGFSFVNFEQIHELGNQKNLVGLDAFWSHNGYEFSSEVAWRFSDLGSELDEKGGFIQGVVPIYDKVYAIGRYEYYQESGTSTGTNIWLLGADYRWNRALIFKAEYTIVDRRLMQAPGGFLASIAVLF